MKGQRALQPQEASNSAVLSLQGSHVQAAPTDWGAAGETSALPGLLRLQVAVEDTLVGIYIYIYYNNNANNSDTFYYTNKNKYNTK